MDAQIKDFFKILDCPVPSETEGTLNWENQSLFGEPEKVRIEWSSQNFNVSGKALGTAWHLQAKPNENGWAIVNSENLNGETLKKKLKHAGEYLEIMRRLVPAPAEGWAPDIEAAKPKRRAAKPR